jgi:hypothetical protein
VKPLLLAIVARVWLALHAPPNPELAQAIATAVAEQYDRGTADAPLLAAVVAVYTALESSNAPAPEPVSHDARDGTSCGYLQLPCWRVRGTSALYQVRLWLWEIRHSSLASVDSSAGRARARVALARAALTP